MSQTPNRPVLAILLGVACAIALIVGAIVYRSTRQPTLDDVTAQVTLQIAAKWQDHPVMMLASLQGVTLAPKAGGGYTGFVDYALGDYGTRAGIDVAVNGSQVTWKVNAFADGTPIHRTEFNTNPVYSEFPITDAEVKAFGDWMVKEKYFARDGACLLRKNGATYIVHVCVRRDLEIGVVAEAAFTIMAERLSAGVFNAAPVDVVVCDPRFMTLKVVAHR